MTSSQIHTYNIFILIQLQPQGRIPLKNRGRCQNAPHTYHTHSHNLALWCWRDRKQPHNTNFGSGARFKINFSSRTRQLLLAGHCFVIITGPYLTLVNAVFRQDAMSGDAHQGQVKSNQFTIIHYLHIFIARSLATSTRMILPPRSCLKLLIHPNVGLPLGLSPRSSA